MNRYWIALHVVQWFLIVGLSLVTIALARQLGVLLLRVGPRPPLDAADGGPALGVAAPRWGGILPFRDDDASLLADIVVLFLSAGCQACGLVAPSVRVLAKAYPDMRFALVVRGSQAAVDRYAALAGLEPEAVFADAGVRERWGITDTPYAVFVDQSGAIQERGIVSNREHMEELIRRGRGRALNNHRHDDVDIVERAPTT